jgi:hypothetical protein
MGDWQRVAPTRTELIEFCRREGLPGEDPGQVSFLSVPPKGRCHGSSALYFKLGTDSSPFTKSWACRRWSCGYCAPWMAGELAGDAAESLGVELTPEYAGQIYNRGYFS